MKINRVKVAGLGGKIILGGFIFILLFALLAFLIGENESLNWVLGIIFPVAWLIFFVLIIKYFIALFKK